MLSSNVDDYQSMLCASQAERRPRLHRDQSLTSRIRSGLLFLLAGGTKKDRRNIKRGTWCPSRTSNLHTRILRQLSLF